VTSGTRIPQRARFSEEAVHPIAEVHWQHPAPVAPLTASGYTRQQELERLMAQAIAARWRG
jgi:hypothetical protein